MRSSLPEFVRWQNALRPEDSGNYDALAAAERPDESASTSFVAKALGQLESRLGVVRNNFSEEEARMWSEHTSARQVWRTGTQALRAAGFEGPTDAPIVDPVLSRRAAFGLLAAVAIGLWLTLGVLVSARQDEWPVVMLIAGVLMACLGAAAYGCGIVIRQAPTRTALVSGSAALATLALACICLAAVFEPDSLDAVERFALGSAVGLLVCVTALVAYLSNVAVPATHRLRIVVAASYMSMIRLHAQRIENQVFHRNVAERHRSLAHQMIDGYRHAYRQALPACADVPRSFCEPPVLPEIYRSWFQLFEEMSQ